MKCECGAYIGSGPCLRCLHASIVKANREHHIASIGGPNWYPSHRVKYPKTGTENIRPVKAKMEMEIE